MRLDKYLWAVRLYKTRSLAADACANGRVKMADGDGRELKPSHDVKVGERYSLNIDQLHKEVEVLALPPKYERIRMARQYAFEKRDRGVGRPTKRERREIEEFKYK